METSKVGQYKRGAKTSNQNDWKRIQVNLDSTKVKLLLSYKLFKNINNVTKERDGKSFPSSQNREREREREREENSNNNVTGRRCHLFCSVYKFCQLRHTLRMELNVHRIIYRGLK